jgi:hypothetical protein
MIPHTAPHFGDHESPSGLRSRSFAMRDKFPTAPEQPAAKPLFARIPALATTTAHVKLLRLDARAGFFLSFVDGKTPLATIFDLVAMSMEEALAVFEELYGRGVLALSEA